MRICNNISFRKRGFRNIILIDTIMGRKARVIVKVSTEFGKCCLREIQGLKEGEILLGKYNPVNNAFDFKWNGEDAMLWVGDNAELKSVEMKRGNISTPRNILRRMILTLGCNEYVKLTNPVTILYHESDDNGFATQVNITEVGRYGNNGQCKLVSEFNQLFSLNDASQKELGCIIDALPK